MSLDPSRTGYVTRPYTFEYDWKTVVLYALGIGAKQSELNYLYEARGPAVYPTFGVVPTYAVLSDLLEHTGVNLKSVVHSGQAIRLHRSIPPEGSLTTRGKLTGIFDLKRFAQLSFTTETSINGEPLFDNEWTLLVLDAGGFDGPRPPKGATIRVPSDKEPTLSVDAQTTPEQAALYRLSGDYNPLHIDPEIARAVGFEQGPILHGLCTFGFIGRAVVQNLCSGDPAGLSYLSAQFRKPIWPGEVLKIRGYALDSGQIALEAFAADRTEPVVTNCWAELKRS
ncbi:MAG: MaoC/PaaZ C-terminal domain-containing protein [Polyangiaceae bacterium]|nr:MaoC/PaaZ C-terminal domain-containing protein [Polyangiaceae bacterium]